MLVTRSCTVALKIWSLLGLGVASLSKVRESLILTSVHGKISPSSMQTGHYFSAKVKMLEHASNIVEHTFQIRKIILPNPEILFLHHILQSTQDRKLGSCLFFFLLKLVFPTCRCLSYEERLRELGLLSIQEMTDVSMYVSV